jgi:hypothetical protein
MKGFFMTWERVTPDDFVLAKQEIAQQRAAMLARHAQELASLDAEDTEVDTLERAIDVFIAKFGAAAVGDQIVQLDN